MSERRTDSSYQRLIPTDGQPFEGEILSAFTTKQGFAWLSSLSELGNGDNAQLLYQQRNRIYQVSDPIHSDAPELCIKVFGNLTRLRNRVYRHIGSKAQRAHEFAMHLYDNGAAVAEPVGYVERWEGNQLAESYLLTRYLNEATDLYSEIAYLLKQHPYSDHLIDLLRVCARAVRVMHDQGFLHGDLGPQNILLQRTGPTTWANPVFIDLNRGKLVQNPSLKERAHDLERMKLPTHFLHIFYHLYFDDGEVPAAFKKAAEKYRQRFLLHQRTRKYRHPVRSLKRWLKPAEKPKKLEVSTGQPSERELWVWDRHSGQPAVTLKGKDRKRQRSGCDVLPLLKSAMRVARPIFRQYQRRKAEVFTQPVTLAGRLGVTVEVDDNLARQISQLTQTPGIPVFVRVYFHLGENGWQQAIAAIHELSAAGHEVSVGFIQSRRAIQQPESWADFVNAVLAETHQQLHAVEMGHAINRVKWGLWNFKEMALLWACTPALKAKYPHLTFLGPPVNDFEFQYYPALLDQSPGCFDALSNHLYVDRRGAPENRQGRFSTLEKCLLGQAISDHWGLRGFYITEVNWPLTESGLYSPVAGGYLHKGRKEDPVHVDEITSAAYLVRYALIALCSGTTERIWWWRLAHPGFGLIDDLDGGWRERPGWLAFRWFQEALGNQTFRRFSTQGDIVSYDFDTVSVVYTRNGPFNWRIPEHMVKITDIIGRTLKPTDAQLIRLTGEPIYCFHRSPST